MFLFLPLAKYAAESSSGENGGLYTSFAKLVSSIGELGVNRTNAVSAGLT